MLIQFCQICVSTQQHIVPPSLTSHFLDHSNEDLSFAEDSSRLVFIWKVEFKWAVFPVVYGVPVSWCGVVSKTIGIAVRLAGRNGGLGIGVPNVPWHVRWSAGWWEVGGAAKGKGGNGGGTRQDRAGIEAELSLKRAE